MLNSILPLMASGSWTSGTALVRLATTCEADTPEAIATAITQLVHAFHAANDCGPSDVQCALFTATHDLRSAKPAIAARDAGWSSALMLCLAEMPTDTDLPRCIRALLSVTRGEGATALLPIYLNGTEVLRPDLFGGAKDRAVPRPSSPRT